MANTLFQFTPLREGRRDAFGYSPILTHFNSRPSARGDVKTMNNPPFDYISIHAPPRGATSLSAHITNCNLFQFTPLREGRLATIYNFDPSIFISIHAPPRGATRARLQYSLSYGLFQFTPLREGRPDCQCVQPILLFISIHAPPRGATGLPHHVRRAGYISIHAPPRGATSDLVETQNVVDVFQFTPLREGRLLDWEPSASPVNISIHAPPRGATPTGMSCLPAQNFNSRPSARGDFSSGGFFSFTDISIHAPPRGATRDYQFREAAKTFQFTPLREGRRLRNQRLTVPPRISIHAPPRGATYGIND